MKNPYKIELMTVRDTLDLATDIVNANFYGSNSHSKGSHWIVAQNGNKYTIDIEAEAIRETVDDKFQIVRFKPATAARLVIDTPEIGDSMDIPPKADPKAPVLEVVPWADEVLPYFIALDGIKAATSQQFTAN